MVFGHLRFGHLSSLDCLIETASSRAACDRSINKAVLLGVWQIAAVKWRDPRTIEETTRFSPSSFLLILRHRPVPTSVVNLVIVQKVKHTWFRQELSANFHTNAF